MFGELKQGFLIGLTVCIPVGPIALLIMRRSIADGRLAGAVSGLGAATVDVICGGTAVVGLKAITLMIEHHEHFLKLIGSLFLLGFGLDTLRRNRPVDVSKAVHQRSLLAAYASTAALTIANPLTWMGLVLVSAASGVGTERLSLWTTIFIVLGIFSGSASWWLFLSTGAEWLGRKLGDRMMRVFNTVSGVLLIAVGLFQAGALIRAKWL